MTRSKRFTAAFIAAAMILASAFSSLAYEKDFPDDVISSDRVSMDQFNTFINVLSAHAGDDTGVPTHAYDTGIAYSGFEDARRVRKTLMTLYCGDYTEFLEADEGGTSDVTVKSAERLNGGYNSSVSGRRGSCTIKAGWYPGTNPAESMAQHNAAWALLAQIAQTAPAGDIDAYRYFNDQLCARINYGDSGGGIGWTPYGGLILGKGTCQAYSACFFILCFMTGRKCLRVSTPTHGRNVVFIDGVPKWVDVTWNDATGSHRYFLTDLSEAELNYISTPGTAYEFPR